jgi:hypothetical protein
MTLYHESRELAGHLMIESQGPWAGASCTMFVRDAAALARIGLCTRLLLVQDAVLAAVPGVLSEVAAFIAADGELWVDRFSMLQRGLNEHNLMPLARVTDMDEVAALVLDPAVKVVWH